MAAQWCGYFDDQGRPRQVCPSCEAAWLQGHIRQEAARPLDGRPARDPLSRRDTGDLICQDCAVAETLMGRQSLTWTQARVAIGNDRQEQHRLPGVPMGVLLELGGQPGQEGDLEAVYRWLESSVWDRY
jgi:hypothetical protein